MDFPNRTRIARTAIFLVFPMFWAATSCFGQFETAAVLGAILDKNGGTVPQARVQLLNLDTGTSQSAVSSDDGSYQFLEVRVGRYQVVAEAAGFKRSETREFRVEVGARLRVDAALEIGDVKETVQVAETASILESDSSERGQVIGSEEIVNLPLNGRSSASLALLAPGVRNSYALS